MNLFYHPLCMEHDTGYHPESAARLRAILAALERHGVSGESLLTPELADPDLLARVHDPRYIETVERITARGGGYWDPDTYISPVSYKAALAAAGAAVAAAGSALSGTPGFAIARPPGHHALYASSMGFCIFNNVAVAAEYCLAQGLERVLIVDWDVHHGNGTQDYSYERSDVSLFSTHQYPFYPGTGSLREVGNGPGKGYTANVPLPAGVGDDGYLRVFDEILVPLAHRYRPEVILISAGYDSHAADPLGGMAVTVAGFYALAEMVRHLSMEIDECGGRVAAILEGGYNTEALAASVLATIAALDADTEGGLDSVRTPAEGRDSQSAAKSPFHRSERPDLTNLIEDARRIHKL